MVVEDWVERVKIEQGSDELKKKLDAGTDRIPPLSVEPTKKVPAPKPVKKVDQFEGMNIEAAKKHFIYRPDVYD